MPQEAFDPELGLILATESGELYPNPAAHKYDANPAATLRFLGTMLGKAMYEGIIIEIPLAGFFLKKVRGNRCDLNDLPSLDSELHGNLMKMTAMPSAVADLGLNFTIASEAFGNHREVPLMQGAPLLWHHACMLPSQKMTCKRQ
jgi:ubiquitin-protein ligase E3 C